MSVRVSRDVRVDSELIVAQGTYDVALIGVLQGAGPMPLANHPDFRPGVVSLSNPHPPYVQFLAEKTAMLKQRTLLTHIAFSH